MLSPARLCLLAALLCLPIECFGVVDRCSAQIQAADGPGPPEEGVNNYKVYKVDDGGTEGDCVGVEQVCRASVVPNATLTGRTWFITNIKPYFGIYYDTNIIEDYRIQCPRGTFLHLFVQSSDLPNDPSCSNVDFVNVNATGLNVDFCGDTDNVNLDHASDLQNNGVGRLFSDGRANVAFCSNNQMEPNGPFTGFVMRASCLNPADYQREGCVDFATTLAWDPEFANTIFNPLVDLLMTVIPHRRRRSPTLREMKYREKRGRGQRIARIELTESQRVTFSARNVTLITDGAVDRIFARIGCLTTSSTTIGTRRFFDEAPLEFFGPGTLEVFSNAAANLAYTIPESELESIFLPGPQEMEIANLIYDYIYRNWVVPYPVIDTVVRSGDTDVFPLPHGDDADYLTEFGVPPFHSVSSLGFIQEVIQSDVGVGSCLRAALVSSAPLHSASLPDELYLFCGYFSRSCDLTLRAACREVLNL